MPANLLVWELYCTTRIIDGATYYGQHINKLYPIPDGYLGSGYHLVRSIYKYGKDAHKKDVLFIAHSQEEADEIERLLIAGARKRVENCLNIAAGGYQNFNVKYLPEDKYEAYIKKLSESHKGQQGYWEGKQRSQETKNKISAAKLASSLPAWNKGIKGHYLHTEEWKREQSERFKGHTVSEETKEKIRQSNLGRKLTAEQRAKISEKRKGCVAWNKGKKMEELGIVVSDETRQKLRQAALKRWAKKEQKND
jgi:hypothetical protein